MKIVLRVALALVLSVVCIFNCIGFASVVEVLNINASATVKPALPDVYITDVTPGASA